MREFVSIQGLSDARRKRSLKQDALIFDKLIINTNEALHQDWIHTYPDIEEFNREFNWLEDNQIVESYQASEMSEEGDVVVSADELISFWDRLAALQEETDPDEGLSGRDFCENISSSFAELENRRLAAHLRTPRTEVVTYSAVYPRLNGHAESDKGDIVQICLGLLPVPDETTSWEQILDFRKDEDAKAKYLDLRNWMNEVAKGKFDAGELSEQVEYLLSQYERHLQVYHFEARRTLLETVFVTGAEI